MGGRCRQWFDLRYRVADRDRPRAAAARGKHGNDPGVATGDLAAAHGRCARRRPVAGRLLWGRARVPRFVSVSFGRCDGHSGSFSDGRAVSARGDANPTAQPMVTSDQMLSTADGWWAAIAPGLAFGLLFGLLFGALFGPLRLAGVDYSKWYRDPGDPSEGNDRSWIGLMKATGLTSARTILYLLIFLGLIWLLITSISQGSPALVWPAIGAVVGWA